VIRNDRGTWSADKATGLQAIRLVISTIFEPIGFCYDSFTASSRAAVAKIANTMSVCAPASFPKPGARAGQAWRRVHSQYNYSWPRVCSPNAGARTGGLSERGAWRMAAADGEATMPGERSATRSRLPAACHPEAQYSHHYEQASSGVGYYRDALGLNQPRDQRRVHRCPRGGVFANRSAVGVRDK